MVECASSECYALCSSLKKNTFCWNGFCARDCFKHSEAKWRVLPSLLSEALETGPTVYKSGTLVLVPGRAFFCQSPVVSARPLAGLSRDHFIPRLLILQSATLLNKLLLTSNGWMALWGTFGLLFRYHFHHVMFTGGFQTRMGCARVTEVPDELECSWSYNSSFGLSVLLPLHLA